MLPQDSESIQQLLHIDKRIGNQSDLYVVIKGPERALNIAYGAELEERLKTLESLRSVTFRRDLDYLEDRALLYLSMSELLEIHDDVKETIRREVAKELALETEEAETLDPADDEQGLLGENELNERLERYERPAEYSETDEGRVMVLSARPRFQNTDAESSQKLCDDVKALADEVAKKFPSIQTELQGSFAEQSKRQKNWMTRWFKGVCSLSLSYLRVLDYTSVPYVSCFGSSFRWQSPLWPPSHSLSLSTVTSIS